jgi:CheY-like chemotaxis protein
MGAETILKTTDRAANLTNRLLAFSRKQVIAPEVLVLDTALRDCADMLPRLVGPDIEVSIVSPPELGRVFVDRIQLEQVLMNLAVNARDAMPEGGQLTIESANLEVDELFARSHAWEVPGRYVMLSVGDSGVGMDAQTQAHIFEPFFTTKEKGRGTGLGLAIVYGIVKQSRGQIVVSSVPGQGTSFKIYFPAVEQAVSVKESHKLAKDSPQGFGTVLLAEDEDCIREIVKAFLEGKGYTVLSARDGLDALQPAGEHEGPIDVLLTDIMMPRMRGPQLVDHLAPLHPEMKVIYISGYAENPGLLGINSDLGRTLLQKPFDLDELARRLGEVLAPVTAGT